MKIRTKNGTNITENIITTETENTSKPSIKKPVINKKVLKLKKILSAVEILFDPKTVKKFHQKEEFTTRIVST